MTKLFDKIIVFGDIHFGKKNNLREFNIDCENFILWLTEQAVKENIKLCVFLGDWHDDRKNLNISTLNYSNSSLELLNKVFDQVFLILGNHDLYYRDKREINSVEFARNLKNIKIINKIEKIDNCVFVPWLIGEEKTQLKKIKSEFLFGHLELNSFQMNNNFIFNNEKENINKYISKNNSFIFSGHFHKRQIKDNIIYIGNCFPHNFSDNLNFEKGIMILNSNGEYEFKSWPKQPKYIMAPLSEIEKYHNLIDENTYLSIIIDKKINYEESIKLKVYYEENFKVRELFLKLNHNIVNNELEYDKRKNIEHLKSIDEIVIESLKSLEDEDKEKLIEIYNSLEIIDND